MLKTKLTRIMCHLIEINFKEAEFIFQINQMIRTNSLMILTDSVIFIIIYCEIVTFLHFDFVER